MKKLERRAIICLILALVLFAGLCLYIFRYVNHGDKWAMFYANQHIYHNGHLSVGKIYDRNHKLLAYNGGAKDGGTRYSKDVEVRRATAHIVGDMAGNVSTSAENVFRDRIVGYNLLTGTYSITGHGNDIKLSIDRDLCKTASNAIGNRKGFAGVYNYKTGEIICMVSKPTFDPQYPPKPDIAESGTYINKFLSGRFSPGSVFKLLTTAAFLENLPDEAESFRYQCRGVKLINGEKITCPAPHGQVDLKSALSNSCNCAYAEIAEMVGAENMALYVKKCGLEKVYNMDGVRNIKGSFDFPSNAPLNLGWAGIGQWKDLINPCSFMVYMGAIADGGTTAKPVLLHKTIPLSSKTDRMIEPETAYKISNLMRNNVISHYGQSKFPNLKLYAKTGTAESSTGAPNAWFAGFIKNHNCPYAFVVCIEHGGMGATAAAPVANTILQEAVRKNG